MDGSELLADRFQGHRPQLRAVAYRLLGFLSEAVRVVRGVRAVAERALLFSGVSAEARIGLVGGAAEIVASAHGQPTTVMGFAVRDGRVIEIDILTDPVRFRRLEQEAGL